MKSAPQGRTFKTKGTAVASTSTQAQNIGLDELRSQLEGELIASDDPSYDDARQVFFKGVDRRPAAVAQAAGAEDVAAVVNAARESGVELAVRSGGHSRPGYGTIEGGIVIDLSRMKAWRWTPTREPPGSRPAHRERVHACHRRAGTRDRLR